MMTHTAHDGNCFPRSHADLANPDYLTEAEKAANLRLMQRICRDMGDVSCWRLDTMLIMPDYGSHCDIFDYLDCTLNPKRPTSHYFRSTSVKVCSNLANLERIFSRDPCFDCWHYDIFEDSPCVTHNTGLGLRGPYPRRLQEDDTGVIAAYISNRYGAEYDDKLIFRAIVTKSMLHQHNPVLCEVTATPWDGVPRVEEAASRSNRAGVVTPIARTMWRKSLIAACARVASPGCKHDVMFILEGPQDQGKSTLIKLLAGEKYYSDAPIDVVSKDTMQLFQGVWIHEDAEGVATTKTEDRQQKAHLGRTHDQYRQPYGRVTNKVPRHCVFWATVNPDGCGYLKDITGTRRYWIVECSNIDMDWFANNRSQLWAEAYHYYCNGEKWWLDKDDEVLRAAVNDDRMTEDLLAEMIAEKVEKMIKLSHPSNTIAARHASPTVYDRYVLDGVTMGEIAVEVLDMHPSRAHTDTVRIGRALTELAKRGIIARVSRPRRDGSRAKVYHFSDLRLA